MTTLAQLRSKVANDIRDPQFTTFTEDQVDALINAGVNEVSRVYPKEVIDSVTPAVSQLSYDTDATFPFRVEWFRDGRFYHHVQQNEDTSSQGGWEWFANQLHLPLSIVEVTVPTDYFKVWGYGVRSQLLTDNQVLDADDDGEWGIRMYARWSAYQSMLAERSIFKQWQAQSNNTDVSPTQLQQMVLVYAGEWDRARNHLRRLKRT